MCFQRRPARDFLQPTLIYSIIKVIKVYIYFLSFQNQLGSRDKPIDKLINYTYLIVIYRNSSGSLERVIFLSRGKFSNTTTQIYTIYTQLISTTTIIGSSRYKLAYISYVRSGMLNATIYSYIFALPNSLQIGAGLSYIALPKGSLIIVKNYTGNCLNFTLVLEKVCFFSGLPVQIVSVADYISIGRRKSQAVSWRSFAGIVLVYKIIGAVSIAGVDLNSIADLVVWAGSNIGTISIGLNPYNILSKAAEDLQSLVADKIEISIGIYNKPGICRVYLQPRLENLVSKLLALMLNKDDSEQNYLVVNPIQVESNTVFLVNNLGGLLVFEMLAITRIVVSILETRYRICLI